MERTLDMAEKLRKMGMPENKMVGIDKEILDKAINDR